MPLLKITGFDGVVPRQSATMLSDSQAQQALNVKLYSKELRYWRGPLLAFNPALNNIASIYKFYDATTSYWLTWTNPVDVQPSPGADTTDYRIYYTGDGVPKKTNDALITTGTGHYPRAWLNMGVPAPVAAPTVALTGSGSTNPESRVYVYTYVSTFGSVQEESAPSPASAIITPHTGETVVVSAFSTAPTTNYNITSINIYRSVTGDTTNTYQFVANIPIATTTYSDSIATASLGGVLPTLGWLPPPSDLSGLVTHPSGALVGFSANTVYFSQPYFPHAWPLAYAINVPYPVIGLGVFGTSIVVCTTRSPYIIDGFVPGSMSVSRVPVVEPCVSKNSIVADDQGVVYASPNGLVGIGYYERGLVSTGLFRRDEWQALTPSLLTAVMVDNKYFGVFPTSADGNALIISRDDVPALSFLSLNAAAIHVDSKNASLYYCSVIDGNIYQVDVDDLNPLPFQWRSKRFVLPQATSFSALKLDAEFSQATDATTYNTKVAAIQATNASLFSGDLLGALDSRPLDDVELDGSTLLDIPPPAALRSAQVFIYGDGVLVASISSKSFDPVRLPPFKAREIEVLIVGTLNVRSVAMATTVQELHQ